MQSFDTGKAYACKAWNWSYLTLKRMKGNKMKVSKELYEKLKTLTTSIYDENGREMCNPVPMEISPVHTRPLTLQDQIKRLLKKELSLQAQAQGKETFQEANDFKVDDDVEEFKSNYEFNEMTEEFLPERPVQDGFTESVHSFQDGKQDMESDTSGPSETGDK